jgi:hypothetical protein
MDSTNLVCEPMTRRAQEYRIEAMDQNPSAVGDWMRMAVNTERHVLKHLRLIKPPASEARELTTLYDRIGQTVGQMEPLIPRFANGTATDGDWEKAKSLTDKLDATNTALSDTHQLGYCSVPSPT